MTENDILYEVGDYWVCSARKGFEVYKNRATHAVRVAIIGFAGAEGLRRAKAEADKRATL